MASMLWREGFRWTREPSFTFEVTCLYSDGWLLYARRMVERVADDPGEAPIGYGWVAWSTFPTLNGVWKPSKLHLKRVGWGPYPICGRRWPRRGWVRSRMPEDRDAHAQDAGVCSRCVEKAAKEAA